jgi:hypothetical protein
MFPQKCSAEIFLFLCYQLFWSFKEKMVVADRLAESDQIDCVNAMNWNYDTAF